jgi:hypothetical protein
VLIMKEGCNPEVEIIDPSDIRRMTISIQHILNMHGKPSVEYGVGQSVKFFNLALESYMLYPGEQEIEETAQEITIKSVIKNTGNYAKGLYVDVWTNLTPLELQEGPFVYWRQTEYGLLSDNTFYVSDDFQIIPNDGESKKPKKQYSPAALALEMCKLPKEIRQKEIVQIEQGLVPNFTVADYIQLTQLLTECNPANVFYD